jgi:hypothetical protein
MVDTHISYIFKITHNFVINMTFTTAEYSPKKGPLFEARYFLHCPGRNNEPYIMVEQAIVELLHFKVGTFLWLVF